MPEIETITDRLKKYRSYKKYKNNEFERICGLSNGYLNSTSSPGSKILEQILEACKDLNRAWVLTGEGKMIIEEPFHDIFKDVTKPTKNEQIINMERYIKNLEGQISYLHGRIEFYTSELSKKDHIIETLMKTNCAGCFEGKKGSAI